MGSKSNNVMYHVKPVLQPNIQFQTTNSMYKLKTLQTSAVFAINKGQAADNTEVSVEDAEKILARQETLLANLHRLQEDVSEFERKLKELKSVQKAPKGDNSNALNNPEYRDFVINADPNYPPYALLWLRKLWNVTLNITIHLHSSIQSVPEHLSVFNQLESNSAGSNFPNMTLVWKKVGEDVQLIVSPMKYKTILGEANALRFFDLILSSDDANAAQHIHKNEMLDIAHRLNHASSKDQQSIIAQLQKRLGNEKWLFGSVPTMVDAVVWSSLTKLKRNSMPVALKKYVTSCSEFLGVNISS